MKYTLTDAKATKETQALYDYLMEIMVDRRLLFGQQNAVLSSVGKTTDSDVRQLTGKLPAVAGFDTLALTGFDTTIESAQAAFDMTLEKSLQAAQDGCILTLSAHMPNFSEESIVRDPDGSYDFTVCELVDTRDKSNDCAKEILSGGKYEDVFHAYLDIIAAYAKALDEKEIPILFRPWHEANGGWMWWGRIIDAKTYVELYRQTREYLENAGVHNLIYVYAPVGPIADEKEYLERYPGDAYVDILGLDQYDIYHYREKFHKDFFDNLYASCEIVSTIAGEKKKLCALTETGLMIAKDPDESDRNGILACKNPVLGRGWFKMVGRIAIQHGMPYVLMRGNYGPEHAYLPYVTETGDIHELAYEFLDLFHWEPVLFASKVK